MAINPTLTTFRLWDISKAALKFRPQPFLGLTQ
jgi:hypothetical protein